MVIITIITIIWRGGGRSRKGRGISERRQDKKKDTARDQIHIFKDRFEDKMYSFREPEFPRLYFLMKILNSTRYSDSIGLKEDLRIHTQHKSPQIYR